MVLASRSRLSDPARWAQLRGGFVSLNGWKLAPRADYVPRIRDGMLRNGVSEDDWSGFVQGALEAERRFRQKPPAKECREAKAVKNQADKSFL